MEATAPTDQHRFVGQRTHRNRSRYLSPSVDSSEPWLDVSGHDSVSQLDLDMIHRAMSWSGPSIWTNPANPSAVDGDGEPKGTFCFSSF